MRMDALPPSDWTLFRGLTYPLPLSRSSSRMKAGIATRNWLALGAGAEKSVTQSVVVDLR